MSVSAMKQALKAFNKIYDGCGEVKKDNISKHSNDLATLVRKDCNFAIANLREAIAEAEKQDLAMVGEVGVWGDKREWVGLTNEEREQLRSSAGYNQFMSAGEYAKAVQWATEAKLKEKNVPQS